MALLSPSADGARLAASPAGRPALPLATASRARLRREPLPLRDGPDPAAEAVAALPAGAAGRGAQVATWFSMVAVAT